MTDYLHHVPGRLRVRARSLRCDATARASTLRKLQAKEGIRSVKLNPKAGSVTVFYDVEATDAQQILDFMQSECLRASKAQAAAVRPAALRAAPRPARAGNPLAAEIGRMALGVLVNKGVTFSLASLLGARI
ncbi:HMA2 domain-containing protein [Thioalkalivibrio sp. XN8]|uniref:HMA2 domain-containing protein n=1 Tax=Thioalkalivibrio sp. XN8 TaxID=2712863 RepID=UPI0013ECA315|nr:heavy-metal-associated domain-containing protein [Thioalkalivibrio sp. XN8]NGP54459.1 heavy-metal-associated domain-containing protein [Thioalkalivibrio sp. XN8]